MDNNKKYIRKRKHEQNKNGLYEVTKKHKSQNVNDTVCTVQQSDQQRVTAVVVRIQRKHGKIIQDCDIYIGREWHYGGWNLKQSKWHNPFPLKKCKDINECLAKYKAYVLSRSDLLADLHELKGKRLGCWCAGLHACHGDVLIQLIDELKI
jgi:hypothetical protein